MMNSTIHRDVTLELQEEDVHAKQLGRSFRENRVSKSMQRQWCDGVKIKRVLLHRYEEIGVKPYQYKGKYRVEVHLNLFFYSNIPTIYPLLTTKHL